MSQSLLHKPSRAEVKQTALTHQSVPLEAKVMVRESQLASGVPQSVPENSRTVDFKDKPCSEVGAGSFMVLTLSVLKPELPAPSPFLSFGS